MHLQRTITICLPNDPELRSTLAAFRDVQNAVSEPCFNAGRPVSAVELQRLVYDDVKGTLNSQMTITALRLVTGAYASAKRGRATKIQREARRKARCEQKGWTYKAKEIASLSLCKFKQTTAMFLIGQRGRDADFRQDGTLSIWTVGGRKRLTYSIPKAFRATFARAIEYDSLTVIERKGQLYGRLCLTLDVPDPKGIHPVGIDLNETNALVAVDPDGKELFISGKATKVLNRRTQHTTSRVQQKLATKKAEHRNTRSIRRVLKRLSGRRNRRTRDFARVTAVKLLTFAPPDAVLVFEDLQMQRPEKGLTRGVALRRRLSLWQFRAIRDAVKNKAEQAGIAVALVDPAYTSKTCSRCGLRGVRRRHAFSCPSCGHTAHADVNAAINIRNRFVQSRLDGEPSTSPEALAVRGQGQAASL